MFGNLLKTAFGSFSPVGYLKWILIGIVVAAILGVVTYFVRDYYVTKGLVATQAVTIASKDKEIQRKNEEIENLTRVNKENQTVFKQLKESNDKTLVILAEKAKSVDVLYKKDKVNTAKLNQQEKEIREFYASQEQTPEVVLATDNSISEVRMDAVWTGYCDIQPDNPACVLLDKPDNPGDKNAKPP